MRSSSIYTDQPFTRELTFITFSFDIATQLSPQSQESSQSRRSGLGSPDGILPETICPEVNSSLSGRLSGVFVVCLV